MGAAREGDGMEISLKTEVENRVGNKMDSKNELSVLLTVGQLAKQLQLSVGTIYYWVHRREIPVIRIGKHLRFDLCAVLGYFKDLT